MAKVKIKSSKKLIIVFVCLVLTTLIVFLGLPMIVEREEALIEVVRASQIIEQNVMIEETMLKVVKIGKYNLPDDVIKTKDELVGKYSKSVILPSDNLLAEKFQDQKSNKDQYLYNLEKDKVCVSITVPSLASALSGKLLEGDIVKIYVYKKDTQNNIGQEGTTGGTGTIIEFPELKYVEVVGITNSKSDNIKDVALAIEEEQKKNSSSYSNQNNMPSTILFKCYPEQAKKLIEAENLGKIHVAFVARDPEIKETLLLDQMKTLGKITAEKKTNQQIVSPDASTPVVPTETVKKEETVSNEPSPNTVKSTPTTIGNTKVDEESKDIKFKLD